MAEPWDAHTPPPLVPPDTGVPVPFVKVSLVKETTCGPLTSTTLPLAPPFTIVTAAPPAPTRCTSSSSTTFSK